MSFRIDGVEILTSLSLFVPLFLLVPIIFLDGCFFRFFLCNIVA
jgi:hypothetical protein